MKDETKIETFKENITFFKPVFNIIDNVAYKEVKKYLEEENIRIQPVEPQNHRVNVS